MTPPHADELTFDEFTTLASALQVEPELWRELYPMARDLRRLADRLNRLAPELHQEMPAAALSRPASEGER